MNLVAEMERESEDEDEDKGWWVGTVGIMETWESEEEASEEAGESESGEETHPASSCVRRSGPGLEGVPEYPLGDYPTEEPEGEMGGGAQGRLGLPLK